MKKGILFFLVVFYAFLVSACNEREQVEQTQEYQQVKQSLGSGVQYVWERATDFIENNNEVQRGVDLMNEKINQTKEQATMLTEQAKAEAVKQYEQLKNDAKEQVKDHVNKKIDSLFE